MGGLAEIKTQRIKAILATLLEEKGKICMEYLRDMSDEEIKAELFRYWEHSCTCLNYNLWRRVAPCTHSCICTVANYNVIDRASLLRFKGVGKKTAACVLMFCLAREEFPVDTHVWRISKSLGWVPAKATRDTAYEHLNMRVPPDVRYTATSKDPLPQNSMLVVLEILDNSTR